MSTIVGALACQKDSFLKTLTTTVISCAEHKGHITPKDKQNKSKKSQDKKQESRYAIELGDTVIFPEGGGQPSDIGIIDTGSDKIEVEEVIRDKLTALHLTHKPIDIGTKVDLSIDWQRRYDHMQQHTGQHLLSAIFDQYKLDTLSWSLGETMNYIELPEKISDELIEEVGEKVNQAIIDDIPITVEWPDDHGGEINISKIPDDYDLSKGLLRIVKIGNLDRNPCCGTHLKTTGQIQAVSIFHQLNVKGGNSRLFFTCGSRVFRQLSKNYNILKNVGGNVLSCQIDDVYEKTKLLNDNYRDVAGTNRKLLAEVLGYEAKKVFDTLKTSKFAYFYRKDSNPEAIQIFQKELLTLINGSDCGIDLDKTHSVVMFNGEKNGLVKVMGPMTNEIVEKVKEILTGVKGGGKGIYQGKAVYEKGEVDSLLKYLESLTLES
ncbi:putative alanyl-tRNA editing protein alaX [[Candida] jaroonii]|uniref:Alanyl-tRNA editing protein alaX n=1 Tax=[Candida] jaroonii TaxID=467808 RepID=A0ACA9Y3Q8_9ASCO|nr:putative alanyl-tRNA editing protein alaX [[Candida] jaroonii]